MSNNHQQFYQKLQWKIYNKEFNSLTGFSFGCFVFKFNITDQKTMESFSDLVCKKETVAIDICNFFLENNIKFTIKQQYIKKLTFKQNYRMFKYVLSIKLQQKQISIKQFFNNLKIKTKYGRKEINKKDRKYFLLELININKKSVCFFEIDTNIWLKPKKIIKNYDNGNYFTVGWLFFQIGKMNFNV